jgi:hypothetical protein
VVAFDRHRGNLTLQEQFPLSQSAANLQQNSLQS